MSNILEVHNLTKTYPAHRQSPAVTVVENVSFAVRTGEVLGLLGPNGAGKSTIISMLLGVLTPTTGIITVFGKDFAKHRSAIMQDMTFASTYVKLPWRLTVWENLRVYALLFGLNRKEFIVRATKFLQFFDVYDHRNKVMSELSAGQMTRVMLAKAFLSYPKIVLLDEPTASLDPDIAHQVRKFVLEQQQQYGTSILYTSHNMDEVTEVCDRVIFLRKGTIVAEDTPENLAKSVSVSHMRLLINDASQRALVQSLAQQQHHHATIEGKEFVVNIDEHAIADFLFTLGQANVKYDQISITKPTLEDYFLEMSK